MTYAVVKNTIKNIRLIITKVKIRLGGAGEFRLRADPLNLILVIKS
jgi:hypothetical protein